MTQPLMPMATAVWLVDNTALTFKQISDFCSIHELEVQGIADGTVAINMVGQDPINNGQLTWDEINRCQADPSAALVLSVADIAPRQRTKGPRYTPLSKRGDKPDAIAWLVRNHPELTDLQISRLVGTTKPTILAIREKTHWNISNISAKDPVALGLCNQIELDAAVQLAASRQQKAAPAEDVKVESEPAVTLSVDSETAADA
ncbi:DUF1013 domain-containing protein [Temperatibacter marinus]|uniref:DUF1013 domain-containing protein n=1 Tax=Temperatibacter marinus TaxID=1456591 RepID=A0AA52EI21_9PROT|nr:cell cycle transcriptional regulator TrcR [Temperatibacter marinus]WND02899.1 DUF1013 domain-containing protein [Temperatibacter marinus]